MTKMEYWLCQKIKAGEIHDWHELPGEEQGLLIAMKDRGWIWLDQAGNVRIEPTGYAALQPHEEELERLEQEAKQQAQETAKQDQEKDTDRAQVRADKQKDRRHDFLVAAFGAAVTLLLEHVGDIADLVKVVVEKILVLFQ